MKRQRPTWNGMSATKSHSLGNGLMQPLLNTLLLYSPHSSLPTPIWGSTSNCIPAVSNDDAMTHGTPRGKD